MTFQALLPAGGLAGWSYLKKTTDAQITRLAASAEIRRDEAYFRERIGKVDTAEALVSDRRLLKVALGAYGLEADLPNRYFIRKVLEEGTLKTDALAAKLADKTYAALSAQFGFGDYSAPRTRLSDFPDKIVDKYRRIQFEEAVGDQDQALRLALTADRKLQDLAAKSSSEKTKWYSILGDAALREVFETAFGLPKTFGTLDLDQQLSTMQAKAESVLGFSDPASFRGEKDRDSLIRRFLVRGALAEAPTPAAGALSLLTQTAGFLRSLRSG